MLMAAIAACPTYSEAYNNLGVLQRDVGAVHVSLTSSGQCLLSASAGSCPRSAQCPQAPRRSSGVLSVGSTLKAGTSFGNARALLAQEAIAAYDKCLELQPGSRNAGQNRLLALNYVHPGELPMVCAEHEEWGIEFQANFEPLPPLSPEGQDLHRRLTVGYLSPDFFTHSVSYFAEAPLTHHNPERCVSLPVHPPW